MAKNRSVMGLYADRTTASDAMAGLVKAGYRLADLSMLTTDSRSSKDFAHEACRQGPAGAGWGAAVGAILVSVFGWLVSTQTLTVPGMATLVAAGPLLAALAGAGAGGAAGWAVGLIVGMGRMEYVARRYAGRMRRGGIVLSVHCDSPEWCDRAKKTLRDTGARDVSAAAEEPADYGTTDRPTERPAVIAVVGLDEAQAVAAASATDEVKR